MDSYEYDDECVLHFFIKIASFSNLPEEEEEKPIVVHVNINSAFSSRRSFTCPRVKPELHTVALCDDDLIEKSFRVTI